MERTQYPLNHEWHVAVNRHSDAWRKDGKEWSEMRFMYEAKTMADEVPRLTMLFKREREKALPQTHSQCSTQAPVPVKDNHLTCCLGVKARECPHLLALEKIERCTPDDVDAAKAWACAAHIVSNGGDHMGEGYMLTVSDRMFWDNVYDSLSQSEEGYAATPSPTMPAEPVETVPWPVVTRYSGGASHEGIGGRVWIRLSDEGPEVEYMPISPSDLKT